MEVDLAVIKSPSSSSEEECVTPRDRGSRIPPPTVCPPAPTKKPAVFKAEKGQEVRKGTTTNEKKYIIIDEAALEFLFALRRHGSTATKKSNDNGPDQQES